MSASISREPDPAGRMAADSAAARTAIVADKSSGAATQSVPIDRRPGLSQREFLHDYVLKGRAVIVVGATSHWPAMQKFNFPFFRKHYAHLRHDVRGTSYSLGEIIDRILTATPDNPAPYPFNLNFRAHFPELQNDVLPEVLCGLTDRANHPLLPGFLLRDTVPYELFFGGPGAAFPRVHYDALWLHNQMIQMVGSKEFFLYPFEQGEYLYPDPRNPKTSQVDFTKPDLDRFPLFAKAKPTVVTVNEGEMIFFPAGVWHATRIHEPCITFGRIQLNHLNWPAFVNDVAEMWRHRPAVAAGVRAYLNMTGRVMALQERWQ